MNEKEREAIEALKQHSLAIEALTFKLKAAIAEAFFDSVRRDSIMNIERCFAEIADPGLSEALEIKLFLENHRGLDTMQKTIHSLIKWGMLIEKYGTKELKKQTMNQFRP